MTDPRATGSARYAEDFELPGMLHARVVRSLFPHARVVRVDASGAAMTIFEISTIDDLARRPLDWLVDQFGAAYGRYLYRASRGEDDSALVSERAWKSISAEHTFNHDTGDRAEIWLRLQAQAHDVAERLHEENLVASEVAIKVRYGVTWETITRQQRLGSPTDDHLVLAAGAAALMRKAWTRRPIRLIGLRASKLAPKRESIQLPLLMSPP